MKNPTLKITIETGNAAFEDYGFASELKSILSTFLQKLDDSEPPQKGAKFALHDTNGNKVGEAEFD